jgi:uncharacterized membrane protein YphA (DoxX/SURF4 family)
VNILLWVVQGLLAAAFLAAGLMKATQPKEKLAADMAWVEDFSPGTVRLIGALEVLAAIGLILAAATGTAPVVTPIAAVGLVLLMAGAAATHARRKEPQMIGINLVLLALAAFVAWGRLGSLSAPRRCPLMEPQRTQVQGTVVELGRRRGRWYRAHDEAGGQHGTPRAPADSPSSDGRRADCWRPTNDLRRGR